MKYLNLGCGTHYSLKEEWINLDFVSTGKGVIAHNLLAGIPFEDNTFGLVYHSHVLEHFSKYDGEKFISECLRVLNPGGVLRIAIPDLERIAKEYLKYLEEGLRNPDDTIMRANYEWMLLEMYDQTVRNQIGGNMAKYLFQESMANEEFVFERIGEEGKALRNNFILSKKNKTQQSNSVIAKHANGIKAMLKKYLLNRWGIDLHAHEIGKFRLGGEIHQWMYDKYSLANLLKSKNAIQIQVRDAFTSYVAEWPAYELDGKYPLVRKPDSLFIEAMKK